MLTKLLKYDLKYMLKNMLVFYILSLVFAISTRILFEFNDTVIMNIIAQISVGCMFSMLASTLVNTLMRSWVRFRDSLYKDESYLTHTLPVTKNQLYDSKFIQTLIFFIVGFVVIVLSLFICYYTKDRWNMLINFINKYTTSLNFSRPFLVIGFLSIIFLEIFNALQCGYFGIILGHRKNNNKIGFSILFGFASYLISQALVLLLTFVLGLFNNDLMALFQNNIMITTESFRLLIISSIVLYIVIIYIMNIICKKILNKGVNIE